MGEASNSFRCSVENSDRLPKPSPLGEELWDGTCAKCHGLEGEGGYGPRIAGTALIKNTQSIEALLRKGGILMPPVGRDWTTDETNALTDYLKERVGNQG